MHECNESISTDVLPCMGTEGKINLTVKFHSAALWALRDMKPLIEGVLRVLKDGIPKLVEQDMVEHIRITPDEQNAKHRRLIELMLRHPKPDWQGGRRSIPSVDTTFWHSRDAAYVAGFVAENIRKGLQQESRAMQLLAESIGKDLLQAVA